MNHRTQQSPQRGLAGYLLIATASAAALVLAGCASGLSAGGSGSGFGSNGKGSITGLMYGGQQPITGARVYLFAAGTTGYTAANTSLLSGGGVSTDSVGGYVVTDGSGGFAISGDYACPATPNTPVYIVGLGGNPGGPSANPNLGIMTALGSCDTLKANANTTFITINELTTVASAYALAGFAQTSGQPAGFGFSSSAANFAGLTNAFASVSNLVSTSSGSALTTTPAGNGTVPQSKLNTLADVLQSCVNSTGGTAGDTSACGNLFSLTTVNSVAPTNTILATLNIAQNPSQNVSAINDLTPPSGSAFVPSLSSAPSDWTVAVKYSGGGISTPQAVAIDGTGNVWVPSTNNSVAELSAGTGSFVSGSGGFTSGSLDAPVSVAIDKNGAVWIANCGSTCSGSANPASVTKYVPSGPSVTASNFTSGGLNATYSIAVDGSNNIWTANTLANTLTLLNNSGVPQSGASGYSSTNLLNPLSTAVDTAGLVWSVSPSGNALVALNDAGATQAGSYTGAALNYPSAVAIDHSGRAWVANQGANSVAVIASGAPLGSAFTGAGITGPDAITLDGAGAAWVSNMNKTISELTSAGTAQSGSSGYTASGLTYANGVAVDPSGNVWVSNCGSYCTSTGSDSGSVFEFIGAGAPTATPLASAAANNSLASKP